MIIEVNSEKQMIEFGRKIAQGLIGGEVIELIGDVGAGKTKLTKGIAEGLGVEEKVQSPSFTICRNYRCRDGLTLAHYDFYRLNDPGIMANEISEMAIDPKVIIVIEWADVIKNVLPDDRLSVKILPISENVRKLTISGNGSISDRLLDRIDK